MPSGTPPKEFVAIDESGDPGPMGSQRYVLIALHVDESALYELRTHITAFRYHGGPTRELKNAGWADKPIIDGNGLHRLLDPIASMVHAGSVVATATWLDKATYKANRGPYLDGVSGASTKFRHFQLRRLLEHHIKRRQWGPTTDLVIDRWSMTQDQRRNLEDYLRGNLRLRPAPMVTLVDSAYCDIVQIADIIGRLVRRTLDKKESPLGSAICTRLIDVVEIRGGLY